MTIWYNVRPFGIVCGRLVYVSLFGMFGARKIWQSCSNQTARYEADSFMSEETVNQHSEVIKTNLGSINSPPTRS
jgi:hypothetical protein